jgi:phosphohistidine swiveling domain-containing protein
MNNNFDKLNIPLLQKWRRGKGMRTEYYRQRFDACPFFMSPIYLGELKYEARKGKSLTASCRIAYYHDGKCDWYLPQKDLDKATNFFLKQAKKDANISKKYLAKWEKDEKLFYDYCLNIEGEMSTSRLQNLNNQELIEELKNFMNLAVKRFSSSSIIDHFALGSDKVIADLILQALKKRKLEQKFVEYFSILTAPTKQSFINEAEIDLLIAAYEFKKHKDIALIDKHQEKFFWIHNNYIDDNILGTDYFLREIKKLITSRQNLLLKAGQIKNIPRQNKIKKQKLIKKIKLSRYLQTLLKISDDFCWWQDERKKSSFWFTHYTSLFLHEIAKRSSYSVDELKYLLPEELFNIFNKSINKKIIKKRIQECVYIGLPNKNIISVETQDFASLRKLLNPSIKPKTKLTGLVASPGYARGRVKICLSHKDTADFKKGEILVAIMTRPDYIEAIKKAEAIVCEEGGLTSHAALIARELQIPCLIAVPGATVNFKNNDFIEVDCRNGYAQLLSSVSSSSSS